MKTGSRLRGILLGVLVGLTPAGSVYSAASPHLVAGNGAHVGGYFTAGPDGATLAIPGGASVVVAPGASMRVFRSSQRLRMPAGYMTNTWSVAVRNGRVSAEVTKPKRSAVLLTASTRFSVAVARGTGSLLVSPEETVAVNERGQSHAILNGRWSRLAEGSLVTVDRGGVIRAERTLEAPKFIAGQRLWVSTGSVVKLDGVRWTKVADAREYEVVLRQPGEEEPLLAQVSQAPQPGASFGLLSPGRYDLVVRAVDQRGIAGAWSEPVTVRIVGVAVPDGSYISRGAVHLGWGQKARFTHSEGLVLSHPGVRTTLPASSPVPLHKNRRTTVGLRIPGTPEVTVANLVPRAVRAVVDVGPKTARWPRDEVRVSVRLEQSDKAALPIHLEARPRVTIGIDPVELEWHREGDRLEAIVPPSRKKGPWVVRVEVADQYGVPLGRDFLEVARGR